MLETDPLSKTIINTSMMMSGDKRIIKKIVIAIEDFSLRIKIHTPSTFLLIAFNRMYVTIHTNLFLGGIYIYF